MKNVPTKVLSAAAVAALLSAPVAPYAAQAATPAEVVTPADGFYVVNPDESKLYFTIDDLIDNTQAVADAINATSMDNVYLIQEGKVVTVEGLFEGEASVDYTDGSVPAGDYVDLDGKSVTVGDSEGGETPGEDLAEAIAAAEAAIAELPEEITLDDKAAVEAARALVEAVYAIDADAEIAGLDTLEAAEAKIAELEEAVEELKVESVSAINAKTLEVTFNKALTEEEQEAAVFEVKRGTVKPSVKAPVFSEDKTTVTIEANVALVAGDYTVTVTGLSDEALTATTTVAAEKLTKVNFLSDVAVISANKEDILTKVTAENQYGEDITSKLNTSNTNITVSASKTSGTASIDKDGNLLVPGGAAGFFKVDDKVVVTVVDSATGVTATKTLTVAQGAAVESIELGEIKTDDKELAEKPLNVTNMDTKFDKYYVPVTIKDQYGNTLNAAELNAGGVTVVSSNKNIVNPKAAPATFKDVKGVTVIELIKPTTATHGTAVLTVVASGTGKSANSSIVVQENAKIDTLALSAPSETVKDGIEFVLPFEASDQYGNALVSDKELPYISGDGTGTLTIGVAGTTATINATNATLSYAIDYANNNKVQIKVTPTAKNVVLTAVSATGKAQTLNLTAEAAPKAATIAGVKEDVYRAIQKGETQAINLTDIVLKDQYGEDASLPADFELTFTEVNGAANGTNVSLSGDVLKAGTTSTTATAAAKGSDSYVIKLVDKTTPATPKVLDETTLTLETVELKDITAFGIKEIGKLYTDAGTPKHGNITADYDKAITIFGNMGNQKVKVAQTLLKSTAISAPLTVGANSIVADDNKTIVTNGADKTATLSAVIEGATSPITVTQTVTYSDAANTATGLKVRSTSGAKSEITNGVVSVKVADIADGKKFGPADGNSSFQFYAEDQYGVAVKNLKYTVTNLDGTAATAVAINDAGEITATANNSLVAGDTFTVTAIVDGFVKSVKVIVIPN